jgi:hypothetical protein
MYISLDLTLVWQRWRRRRPACAVERQWQRRRRPVCTCGRAVVVVEETGSSSIDGGRGDQWSRDRQGLREFCNEKRNAMGRATIYWFETISSGS